MNRAALTALIAATTLTASLAQDTTGAEIEAGKHDSADSPLVHEAVVWLALVESGVMPRESVPDFDQHRDTGTAS